LLPCLFSYVPAEFWKWECGLCQLDSYTREALVRGDWGTPPPPENGDLRRESSQNLNNVAFTISSSGRTFWISCICVDMSANKGFGDRPPSPSSTSPNLSQNCVKLISRHHQSADRVKPDPKQQFSSVLLRVTADVLPSM